MDLQEQATAWYNLTGISVDIGKKFTSPFRVNDSTPGCYFSIFKNSIIFTDWADSTYNGFSIVKAYAKYKCLNEKEAFLQIINNVKNSKPILLKSEIDLQVEKSKEIKEIIPIYKENFSKMFLNYWKQRNVTDFTHMREVDKIIIKKEESICTIVKNELCISYIFPDIDNKPQFKLYTPFSIKKEYKFISQVKKANVWWHYCNSNKLLILKASKDYLIVLSIVKEFNINVNLTHLQSENISLNKNYIPNWEIFEKYNTYAVFDNDKAGKLGADTLTDIIGIKCYFTDFGKDIDEMYLLKGLIFTKNWLLSILDL